ncbi:hypothetical protein [Streptomyces triculaminicus]|uniref:hypothetical protein n=1 Tax=Streptomyces triculaminicus TaxID=2816232 RepID=UPI0037D21702
MSSPSFVAHRPSVTHPTQLRKIEPFLRWATARRLTGKLHTPTRTAALPSRFLSDDEHTAQLRRCLNDDTLPREARIVGAMIRLYALPISRITQLRAHQFQRDDDRAYITPTATPSSGRPHWPGSSTTRSPTPPSRA